MSDRSAGGFRIATPSCRYRIDAIDSRLRRLAEKLDPRALDARVVLHRFREREERLEVLVEAGAQRGVGNVAVDEGFMRLREREHIRIDARAKVFERHT